jgi:branched-subunit amino acid permease
MLAAVYAVPYWLQVLHTITAAIGDILTPVSILVGIVLVVVRIEQMRAERREQQAELLAQGKQQHIETMAKLGEIQQTRGTK